jgi:hypothetical protein
MNAGSDCLAIDGSSPPVTRHKFDEKEEGFHGSVETSQSPIGAGVDLHGLCCRAGFPDIYFTPLLTPTWQPGELPLRGKYECCWPFVGVCRMSGDQWIPLSLTLWCFPELAKLRQFPISRADTGTKGAPIEREDIFNSPVSQRIKSI